MVRIPSRLSKWKAAMPIMAITPMQLVNNSICRSGTRITISITAIIPPASIVKIALKQVKSIRILELISAAELKTRHDVANTPNKEESMNCSRIKEKPIPIKAA